MIVILKWGLRWSLFWSPLFSLPSLSVSHQPNDEVEKQTARISFKSVIATRWLESFLFPALLLLMVTQKRFSIKSLWAIWQSVLLCCFIFDKGLSNSLSRFDKRKIPLLIFLRKNFSRIFLFRWLWVETFFGIFSRAIRGNHIIYYNVCGITSFFEHSVALWMERNDSFTTYWECVFSRFNWHWRILQWLCSDMNADDV